MYRRFCFLPSLVSAIIFDDTVLNSTLQTCCAGLPAVRRGRHYATGAWTVAELTLALRERHNTARSRRLQEEHADKPQQRSVIRLVNVTLAAIFMAT